MHISIHVQGPDVSDSEHCRVSILCDKLGNRATTLTESYALVMSAPKPFTGIAAGCLDVHVELVQQSGHTKARQLCEFALFDLRGGKVSECESTCISCACVRCCS